MHRVTDGDAARYHDVLIASHTEHLMLEESSDVVHHHAARIITPFPERIPLIQCSPDRELRQMISGYEPKVVEKGLARQPAGASTRGILFSSASRFVGHLAFHAPTPRTTLFHSYITL